jgi:hypothetical protein
VLGLAVIAVAVVIICAAAFLADRLIDAAVGGSYGLVQRACRRRGHRMFWIGLVGVVVLAFVLTALGILANGL